MSQRDRRSPNESGALGRREPAGGGERPPWGPPRGATRRAQPDGDQRGAPTENDQTDALLQPGAAGPAGGFGFQRIDPAEPAAPPLGHDPTDPAAWSDEDDSGSPAEAVWDEIGAGPAVAPAPAPAAGRRRARATAADSDQGPGTARPRRPRRPGPSALPAVLGRLAIAGDRIALGLLGAGLLGLAAMAALVASRAVGTEPVISVHLNAAGLPDRWAGPRILWRLPLLAGGTLAANLILAWALSPLDRFAARFLLAAGLVIQLLIWVALLDLL